MLERFFKRGAIFEWTRPSSVQGPLDGQILQKTMRTTPMSFVGTAKTMGFSTHMDPILTDPYLLQHGLTPGSRINYRWLDYMPGRTARVRIGRRNILTGPMSGCPIAYWTQGGTNYVGHVGTTLGMPVSNALVKQTFLAAAPATATAFNPANAWQPNDLAAEMGGGAPFSGPQILAFVTSQGNFYSTAFFQVDRHRFDMWYCAGSRLVPGVHGPALNAMLG